MRYERNKPSKWPTLPIGPVLEHFGGPPVEDDTGWKKYPCPFHGDRTPSASVNTTINVFVCHTCGVKGGTVHLVKTQENIERYANACSRAEEIVGKSATELYGGTRSSTPVSRRSGYRGGNRSFRRTGRSR